MALVVPAGWRRWLRFGLGVGVVAGERDLEAVVVRARPSGFVLRGYLRIADYIERPAAEWGAELTRFLAGLGAARTSALAVLPREVVIVRSISLPGVRDKDAERALSYQLDGLHPWEGQDIDWSWQRTGTGSIFQVAIAEAAAVERYTALFSEAGIRLAGLTFSGSAMFTARRIGAEPPQPQLMAVRGWSSEQDAATAEVYAESESHPLYNAVFAAPPERAASLAGAETRLPQETECIDWFAALPAWKRAPDSVGETDAARSSLALAWASGLAAACPWLATPINLLPPALRAQSSRLAWVPSLALGLILLALGGALLIERRWLERGYVKRLNGESQQLEPVAQQVAVLDGRVADQAQRIRQLDAFRERTRNDLEVLLELTRQIPPQAALNQILVSRGDVQISGEIPQAEGLLKKLDESPLFEASEFSNQISRNGDRELFRIRTLRKGERAAAAAAQAGGHK